MMCSRKRISPLMSSKKRKFLIIVAALSAKSKDVSKVAKIQDKSMFTK